MTLTLTLTPEIEQYLAQGAIERGISLSAYTLQLLAEYIARKKSRQNSSIYFSLGWMKRMVENSEKRENIRSGHSIPIDCPIDLYFPLN